MKHLFSNFRANNIRYDPTTAFNGKGEFHSCLNFEWEKMFTINKDYGTSSYASKFDFKGDTKIRLAVKKTIINPYDDYDDLINTIFFCAVGVSYSEVERKYLNYYGKITPMEYTKMVLIKENFIYRLVFSKIK